MARVMGGGPTLQPQLLPGFWEAQAASGQEETPLPAGQASSSGSPERPLQTEASPVHLPSVQL